MVLVADMSMFDAALGRMNVRTMQRRLRVGVVVTLCSTETTKKVSNRLKRKVRTVVADVVGSCSQGHPHQNNPWVLSLIARGQILHIPFDWFVPLEKSLSNSLQAAHCSLTQKMIVRHISKQEPLSSEAVQPEVAWPIRFPELGTEGKGDCAISYY